LKFKPEYSIEVVFEKSDVIINFSNEIYYSLSTKYLKPMLLGSTGHQGLDLLTNPPFAFMYAPNVLIEWSILKAAAEKIASLGNFTISIDDIHHPAKKDAPSGTAKDLAFAKEADIRSVRRPMISSWHQISFFDENQVIKLEHQVFHRSAYADSSLKIAKWLLNKEPGKYDMQYFIFN
jgi:4-hydroxy-tetrahydrodipicolinate reductase